jgi:glycosyltransferase involved in cell wall biosynthesis
MKVSAIIPAFNEEKTIASVIKSAKSTFLISEVIVVDDGSFDNTFVIAEKLAVKTIKLSENQGKGKAMEIGVKNTNASILVFIDADLVGIKNKHLESIIKPILKNEVEMTIGVLDRKKFGKILDWLVRKNRFPFSGTRALKREFWDKIPEKYKKKYYIESALSYFAKEKRLKIKTIILKDVKHFIKEKKYGILKGIKARIEMFLQIVIINLIMRIK